MHDLHAIAGLQHCRGELMPLEDRQVDLHDHALGPDVQLLQQRGHGRVVRHLLRFPVHENVHCRKNA